MKTDEELGQIAYEEFHLARDGTSGHSLWLLMKYKEQRPWVAIGKRLYALDRQEVIEKPKKRKKVA